MKYQHEYEQLIALMVDLIQSQSGKSIESGDEWLNDAQTLSLKLFKHLVSMQCLITGTTVSGPKSEIQFIDHSSLKVVARAAFETYLVYFYVYGAGQNGQAQFRHLTWKLDGLYDRQKFHATTPESKLKLNQEKLRIDQLENELKNCPELYSLSQKQQNRVLAGEWRVGKGWANLAEEAGFHEEHFKNIYGYLCGYSHASYLSALQVGGATNIADQLMLAESMMSIGLNIMGHFSKTYPVLFSSALKVVEDHPARTVAEKWQFGASELSQIYGR